MPVFVGQNHVPEYDPPPPPLTKEEQEASQEKVDYEAYNERQRLKFEIPPPRWKGKYQPKTKPKYEYVSVVPHYPTEGLSRTWEHIIEPKEQPRHLTEEEQRILKNGQRYDEKQVAFQIQQGLAPGEMVRVYTGDLSRKHGYVFRVTPKIVETKYSYPETDFQFTPIGKKPASLDICYHYNEDDNRVLQEFAEQGWELVSCINNMCYGGETRGKSSHTASRTFYFRRELELIPDTTNAD